VLRPNERLHSAIIPDRGLFAPEPDTSDARIPALRAWLVSQRIGPYLELHELARGPFATFHVEWRSRRDRRVDALSLPAVIRIIDAAVEAIPLSRLN
jgi:hypothetical protein